MKRLVISLITALIITSAGALMNYLHFQKTGHLLLAARVWGGEITVEYGFGWRMVHIFAMSPEEQDSIYLLFQYMQFFLQALATALVVFLILSIISALRSRKASELKK